MKHYTGNNIFGVKSCSTWQKWRKIFRSDLSLLDYVDKPVMVFCRTSNTPPEKGNPELSRHTYSWFYVFNSQCSLKLTPTVAVGHIVPICWAGYLNSKLLQDPAHYKQKDVFKHTLLIQHLQNLGTDSNMYISRSMNIEETNRVYLLNFLQCNL